SLPPAPRSALSPYTTLFRSSQRGRGVHGPAARRTRDDTGSGAPQRRDHAEHRLAIALRGRALASAAPGADARTASGRRAARLARSEEHTSELQSRENLVCRL